jgi:DNA polymerase-3 subunit delta
MTAFRPQDHRRLLSEVKARRFLGVLVYGNDAGGIVERIGEIMEACSRAEGAPGSAARAEVVTLEEDTLAEDPGRLSDEMRAISMFGDFRIIRVRDAGERTARAVKELLDMPPGEALLIAQAGPLKPSSALRRLFEQEDRLAAIPVYEDTARDIEDIIRETLSREGLSIDPDALAALSAKLGADRAASRSELEKLALYCLGRKIVRLEDVQAICGDVSAHAVDGMLDAYFSGDYAEGTRLFAALLAEGVQPARMLAAAAQHVHRLSALAMDISAGKKPREAVKGARPPIFFRRHDSIIGQLSIWTPDMLERAGETLMKATAESRRHPALDAAIAERCLLSLSVQARRRAPRTRARART